MLAWLTLYLSLFDIHPRYIVERADPALWHKVLDEENPHRASLIEQVVGTALPESRNPEQVRGEGAGQLSGKGGNRVERDGWWRRWKWDAGHFAGGVGVIRACHPGVTKGNVTSLHYSDRPIHIYPGWREVTNSKELVNLLNTQ